MEDILFATVLYIAVVSGLCWLTTPLTRDAGTGGLGDAFLAGVQNVPDAEIPESANLPHHRSAERSRRSPITPSPSLPVTPSPHRPVASGLSLNDLKNAFAVEPESEPDSEVTQEEVTSPTNANIPIEDINILDIETLKLRPARKIASQLGIQQKVGGKDQPLSWLRAQIKKRLEEDGSNTAPIIRACLNAA